MNLYMFIRVLFVNESFAGVCLVSLGPKYIIIRILKISSLWNSKLTNLAKLTKYLQTLFGEKPDCLIQFVD